MFECRVSGQVWFYRVRVIPPRVSGFQVPNFITNSKSEIFNVFWKSHPKATRRNYRHLAVLFFSFMVFYITKALLLGYIQLFGSTENIFCFVFWAWQLKTFIMHLFFLSINCLVTIWGKFNWNHCRQDFCIIFCKIITK